MNITIIGTGYVGLVAGVCFASTGNSVICVDANPQIVQKLSNGEMTIYEPGLAQMLADALAHKRITFTTDLARSIQASEVLFIAVGTPMNQDRSADLSAVRSVAQSIKSHSNGYKIIVTKSTVPVGTGDMIESILQGISHPFDVVSNPEFLKEGSAIEDFIKPDRVVVGYKLASVNAPRILKTFKDLYHPFMMTGERILFMDRTSAELTKYAANAMLAVRISFMNELSQLAESAGANIDSVRKGIGSDSRIGKSFLFAGPGYGGSCFPKDVAALVQTAKSYDVKLRVVEAADVANNGQHAFFLKKIISQYDGSVQGKTFALWGLAFKAKTDDVRLSPALFVAQKLVELGAKVIAFDPEAMGTTRKTLGDSIVYAKSAYECFPADALIIMTDWNEFRSPDFTKIVVSDSVIFDSRNLYELESMKSEQFTYISIGRPTVHGTKTQ